MVNALPTEFSRETKGELWQYLEVVSFTATGTVMTLMLSPAEKISSIAYSIFDFLAGKASYWLAKQPLEHLGLKSKRITRGIGWTTGILIGAAAGWKLLQYSDTPITFGQSLAITLLTAPLGYCLRELSFKSIKVISSQFTRYSKPSVE